MIEKMSMRRKKKFVFLIKKQEKACFFDVYVL